MADAMSEERLVSDDPGETQEEVAGATKETHSVPTAGEVDQEKDIGKGVPRRFARWVRACARRQRQSPATEAEAMGWAHKALRKKRREETIGLSLTRCAPDSARAVRLRAKLEAERAERLNAESMAFKATNQLLSIKNDELNAEVVRLREQLASKDQNIQDLCGTIDNLSGAQDELQRKLDASRAENADLVREVTALKENAASHRGKVLAGAMAKPPNFDGKGLLASRSGQQVDDWIGLVQRYAAGLQLSSSETVVVAASFLREDAARAWSSHEAFLQASNMEVGLTEMRECLLKRFTPAATVLQARMQLSALTLGKGAAKSLAAYVTEFDRLCALVPDLSEGDKTYKFYEGIKRGSMSHLVEKCCMDPVTSTMFTAYARMRTAALNAAVHSAEFQAEVAGAVERLAQRESGAAFKKQRRNSDSSGGAARAAAGGASSSGAAGGSQGRASTSKAGGSKAANKSDRPNRTHAVFQFCKENGLCLRCYGKHVERDCNHAENQVAQGLPPGMK